MHIGSIDKILKAALSLITLMVSSFAPITVLAQTEDKFHLNYVGSGYLDSAQQSVMVVFAVTPVKIKDYPPLASMKISYSINNQESLTVVDIMKQKESKIQLTFCGETAEKQCPEVYAIIKDKISLSDHPNIMLYAFKFKKVSTLPIQRMTVRYGLWEKRDRDIRNEKDFVFAIGE